MKKNYCSMEAYKVSFNAKEQVAAACAAYDAGNKYSVPANGMTVCDATADGSKYTAMGFSWCFFTDDGAPDYGMATKYQS